MRKTNFSTGKFYHIYNRGNGKNTIFHDNQDYTYFVQLLYLANDISNFKINNITRSNNYNIFSKERENQIVSIGSYVLMPNHFHILLTEKIEGGVSKFIQKLCTAYVMYYNKKYDRTGSLFEGKFKSKHINTEPYMMYIFSYIHLNPVKLIQKDWKEVGIKNTDKVFDFLNKYKYSSYADYIETNRQENKILEKGAFPNYLSPKESFKKDILSWLKFKEENMI